MAKSVFGLVHRLMSDAGLIEPGATVEFYDAGTTTPRTVYSDRALSTTAGTSLTADANGVCAERWVADTVNLKLVYKDASGSTKYTRDYQDDQRSYPFVPPSDSSTDLGSDAYRWRTVFADNLELRPGSSRTPASNGDLSVEATNNSALKFKFKGDDGTVRTGTVALDGAYAESNMNSLAQTVPVSTITQIALAGATVNTGSYFNTTTKRYTPPLGDHSVNFAFLLSTNMADGDDISIGLRKNGTEVRRITQSATQAAFAAVDGVMKFQQTVITDYWDLAITIDGAGSDRTLGSTSFSALNNWAIWRQE